MTNAPLKIALLGCGTVGTAVMWMLANRGTELESRIGRRLEVVGIAVRDTTRERAKVVPTELLTDDAAGLVSRGDVDIVVELMGGTEGTYELIMSAIEHGASVVTANKALLAERGKEIFTTAEAHGVDVYYEAAVAGAIPIIRPLRESLVGDEISLVMGIVNGTTNYILDQMTVAGMDYDTALRQAQELGYAEADPTADVGGHDAAAKAALLASLAFHTWVDGNEVYREGITDITSHDIRAARSLGYQLKLLAVIKLGDDEKVSVRVHPTMVPNDHPLATVSGAYNAIFIEAESADRLMFLGPGAGGPPTASAVVGDLVTVARHRAGNVVGPIQSMYTDRTVAPIDDTVTRYFLRLEVSDEPGVLAEVAGILADHDVSVETVMQTPSERPDDSSLSELFLMTHQARESNINTCVSELKSSARVTGDVTFIRVEGM